MCKWLAHFGLDDAFMRFLKIWQHMTGVRRSAHDRCFGFDANNYIVNRIYAKEGDIYDRKDDLNDERMYEGVEDEDDEKRCINMHASYLQGYKYNLYGTYQDL